MLVKGAPGEYSGFSTTRVDNRIRPNIIYKYIIIFLIYMLYIQYWQFSSMNYFISFIVFNLRLFLFDGFMKDGPVISC